LQASLRAVPWTGLALVAVCLAASVPYASTLNQYFLGDDYGHVQLYLHPSLLTFLSLFFTPVTQGIYGVTSDGLRPMFALTYQLDALIDASSPLVYHATNVALHALTALLVFATARRVAQLSLPAATFAGILFPLLPSHVEAVAWITGRAAIVFGLMFLAAFLAYAAWRRGGAPGWYAAFLALFFLALFSKQSGITMVPLLVAYDALVARRRLSLSWGTIRPYLPPAALTLGYLSLNVALLGNAARENQNPPLEALRSLAPLMITTLEMLGSGRSFFIILVPPLLRWLGWALVLGSVGVTLLAAYVLQRAPAASAGWARLGRLVFFGPAWWVVNITPLTVGAETPRQIYLAAVGAVLAAAILLDPLWRSPARLGRPAGAAAGLALVVLAAQALPQPIANWNNASRVSERVTRDLERAVLEAPPGSLLVVDAPSVSHSWSFPFVLRPPFMSTDLSQRVFVVPSPQAYCCPPGAGPGERWAGEVRAAVQGWSERPDSPPVVTLKWDRADPAAPVAQVERAAGVFHSQARALGQARSPADMFLVFQAMFDPAVARQTGYPLLWGSGIPGRPGQQESPPTPVGRPCEPAIAVAAGRAHGLLLRPDTTVWAWGANDHGQLGAGSTGSSDTPVEVPLIGVRAIAAGEAHSLALKHDGTVWAWGANGDGQLGIGRAGDSDRPLPVRSLPMARAIAAGGGHSLALLADGTVWAWGRNDHGQLGDNSTRRRRAPVRVQDLADVVAIAAGTDFSLALTRDGTVWAWGANDHGQLGDGTTEDRDRPVQVQLGAVRAIAAGARHSLALASDGTVWAWGANDDGQLGDGSSDPHATPEQVSLLSGVTAIAAGARHSLALTSDGAVWTWGTELASPDGEGSLIPIQAGQGLQALAISARGDYTLALVPHC